MKTISYNEMFKLRVRLREEVSQGFKDFLQRKKIKFTRTKPNNSDPAFGTYRIWKIQVDMNVITPVLFTIKDIA